MVASFRPARIFGQKITRSCLKAVLTVIMVAYAAPSLAQTPPATCDPAYWTAMKSRAWMEAQREITQNQNLIYKADSVLEYTCFNRFLSSLGGNAVNLFSETQRWGDVLPDTSMDEALENLVANGLAAYQTGNFDHDFLGDRADGMDHNLAFAFEGAGYVYTCDVMSQVWQAAKCMNFIDEADLDDFFFLRDYEGMDPRELPLGLECNPDPAWANRIAEADNTAEQYLEADYEAYADFFSAAGCTADPIPTGVQVQRVGTAPYAEFVCVNPGCGYTGGGCAVDAPNMVQ